MARILRLLLVLLALFLTISSVWGQDSTLPDLGGREIRIAVENAYPPYNFINEAGERVGGDYDTFRDICRRLPAVMHVRRGLGSAMSSSRAYEEYEEKANAIS